MSCPGRVSIGVALERIGAAFPREFHRATSERVTDAAEPEVGASDDPDAVQARP